MKEYNIFSDWSGIIVCQGSGIWYPAAIYHEEDLFCGLRSEQTLTSIDSVNAQFTEIMGKIIMIFLAVFIVSFVEFIVSNTKF